MGRSNRTRTHCTHTIAHRTCHCFSRPHSSNAHPHSHLDPDPRTNYQSLKFAVGLISTNCQPHPDALAIDFLSADEDY